MPDKGYGYTWEDESRQPMFIITTAVLILCSSITVALRLYCRLTFVRHIGIDDKFMIVAWLFAFGLGVQNVLCVYWGTGRHRNTMDMSVARIPTYKHWYAYQIAYPWALFFVKASILALYHMIFVQTRFRYLVYAMASFVSIQTVVVTFVNAFECGSKPWRAWSPTFPAGCNNLFATYFSMAAVNIFTDIVILVMPIQVFKQLKLPRSKRYALLGVFLVGGVAVIASIVRLYALWLYAVTKEVLYDMIFILLLSQIEVNAAIISASAPALRPLIKAFVSSSHGESERYTNVFGSGGPSSKILGRSTRSRPNGPVELFSFGGNNRTSKVTVRGTRSTSEESILGVEATGITRTIETKIEEDCVKQPGDGQYVGAQGYEGPRRSDV